MSNSFKISPSFVTDVDTVTKGTLPTGDNSSIGTDLVAWKKFQNLLYKSITASSPFTTDIVSTYTLVYTTNGAYFGGVLAPNGDIHFIPFSANRGQKVSASGTVSTYSLVYTNSSGAYVGGVLAKNGDIHFVPYIANRGQKVNTSGTVSTYSLVYTNGAGAYIGGVLAPNGDIHFVPYTGIVGQKISAAGVVSTYSLVYTTTNAYRGGVLAPNGNIHFVPYDSFQGQAINTGSGMNFPLSVAASPWFNKF